MLRGFSVLLRRSLKHFAPVVEVIAQAPSDIWTCDVDDYSDPACDLILNIGQRLRAAFPEGASDILITKIMLGVFGCVPAFDTYVKKGFGVSTFGRGSLRRVAGFLRRAGVDASAGHRV